MADIVGTIQCPLCETEQEVRQEARRAACLYISCKNCGTLQPRLRAGQAYMEKHTNFEGEEPEPVTAKSPENEKPPEPEKERGWLANLFKEDDE